jgi:MoxR-like ATPase
MAMINRDEMARRLDEVGYIADPSLALALSLMDHLRRPLLVEGEAGVGKTEIAYALAALHGCRLIRLQCYEGLDASGAIYEWNYQRQLLSIKAREGGGESASAIEQSIFSEDYLLERPLLAAIRAETPVVLLIDEIDRADEEFEAFLLEMLSTYRISIPELGTVEARSIPRVVLTSNGTRELSDALRRRCLFHYLDYPDEARETRILLARQPDIDVRLAQQVAGFVGRIRKEDLRKVPGVAETLDWAAALIGLGIVDLKAAPETVHETLICLLKTQEDRANMAPEVTQRLLGRVA